MNKPIYQQFRDKGNCLNLTKGTYKKLTVNIKRKTECPPPKIKTMKRLPGLATFDKHCTTVSNQGKNKEIKCIQIVLEEEKLSLFADT